MNFPIAIPRPAQPTLTRLILQKIDRAGEVLLDSFFPAKYPEARLWRRLLRLDSTYEFKRPTFAAILSKLKSQGLVETSTKKEGRFWRLSTRGHIVFSKQHSAPRPDGMKRLVCFDIPERDRAKRRWLRGELIACGY